MINKKALGIFLGLTFGSTLTLIIVARALGFTLVGTPVFMSQVAILAAMFMPGVSAIITQKLVLKKSFKELGFCWGPWSMYLKTYVLIVGMYVVNYGITWIFFVRPDFTLQSFINQYAALAPNLTLPLPAPLMILIFSLITFVAAPLVNMIPSLGEEIGWRGFLLPQLEPLGQTKAMIMSGVIWALWHTPMILILGFIYGTQIWPGVLLHFAMVTGLGIWMGYIWFRTRSTVLSGFIHAVFNANAYGIWAMLFISPNKLIIGMTGALGAALCLILGIATIYVAGNKLSLTENN